MKADAALLLVFDVTHYQFRERMDYAGRTLKAR